MNKNKCKYVLGTIIIILGFAINSLSQEPRENDENIFISSLQEAKRKHLRIALIDWFDVVNGIPAYKANLEQLKVEFEAELTELIFMAKEINALKETIESKEKDKTEVYEMNNKLSLLTKLYEEKKKDVDNRLEIRKQELLEDMLEKIKSHMKLYLKEHNYDAVHNTSYTKFACVEHNFSKLSFITDDFIKSFNNANP